jgi:hypothetical protein
MSRSRATWKRVFVSVFFGILPLLALLALPDRLTAQYETGTISGTATDGSGAADAKIEASNVGTNVTQTTVSYAAGRYRIADVEALQAGFPGLVRKGITLTVGANLIVDFSLQVGAK